MKPVRVLFLGPIRSPLVFWLRSQGEIVIATESKITLEYIRSNHCEILVSYGYRHILHASVLDFFSKKCAMNLHISILPFNRGASPNFWSFVDNTPKGVTIHYLDEGIDTGDILAQQEVFFSKKESATLASTYNLLQKEIQILLKKNWKLIRERKAPRKQQKSGGSYYRSADLQKVFNRLPNKWNTPIFWIEKHRELLKLK